MISVAVTAYNESKRGECEWIKECAQTAAQSPIVGEVVVADDSSEDFPTLKAAIRSIPKIRIIKGSKHRGVFGNKVQSVYVCQNEWVQICDSDDSMDVEHFRRVGSLSLDPNVWYCNSWGKPRFDYRSLCGVHTASRYLDNIGNPWLTCQFNTGNHLVHRNKFISLLGIHRNRRISKTVHKRLLERYEHDQEYWDRAYDGADSAFYNSRWLLNGGSLYVVPGLEYEHRYNATDTGAYHVSPPEKTYLQWAYLYEVYQHVHGGPQLERLCCHDRRNSLLMFDVEGGKVVINTKTAKIQEIQL